jgi:hypothetical protein
MRYSTDHILALAKNLIQKAQLSDVVLTIETKPNFPPETGSYEMMADVRQRLPRHMQMLDAGDPPFRSLYEITGDIQDINTMLVPRTSLLTSTGS